MTSKCSQEKLLNIHSSFAGHPYCGGNGREGRLLVHTSCGVHVHTSCGVHVHVHTSCGVHVHVHTSCGIHTVHVLVPPPPLPATHVMRVLHGIGLPSHSSQSMWSACSLNEGRRLSIQPYLDSIASFILSGWSLILTLRLSTFASASLMTTTSGAQQMRSVMSYRSSHLLSFFLFLIIFLFLLILPHFLLSSSFSSSIRPFRGPINSASWERILCMSDACLIAAATSTVTMIGPSTRHSVPVPGKTMSGETTPFPHLSLLPPSLLLLLSPS